MAVEQDQSQLNMNGINPNAVEKFNDRLPEVEEGDYMIGGRLREDFKPFVYSGLLSEFPVNGETVYIVTERGEKASNGYKDKQELADHSLEVIRSEAFKVLDAETETENQAIITEELLSQHRAKIEHEARESDQEAWRSYLELGSEMVDQWEEAYNKAAVAEDETITDYAEMLNSKIESLKGDLNELAREKDDDHIEDVREDIYELESLTQQL